MRLVLSVDPGTRGSGVAVWIDGKLLFAKYVKNTAAKGNGPREVADMAFAIARQIEQKPDHLVLEHPQTYGGRAGEGDANDLFPLAGVDGALAAIFPNAGITRYFPREWKGSVRKPESVEEPYVIETRVRGRLDPDESVRVVWPGNVKLTWDVSDALGVGLFFLGRFDRKRVFARD